MKFKPRYTIVFLAYVFLSFDYPATMPMEKVNSLMQGSELLISNYLQQLSSLTMISDGPNFDREFDLRYNEIKKMFVSNPYIVSTNIPCDNSNPSIKEFHNCFSAYFNLNYTGLRYTIKNKCNPSICGKNAIIRYNVEIESSKHDQVNDSYENIIIDTWEISIEFYCNNLFSEPLIKKITSEMHETCDDCTQIRQTDTERRKQSTKFKVIPNYAKIYVDNQYKSLGNGENINLKSGIYQLRIEAPSYKIFNSYIRISDKDTILHFNLEHQYGFLTINNTHDDGARIELDGTYIGNVPLNNYQVSTGTHTLRVSKYGYWDMAQAIYIVDNEKVNIIPNLIHINDYYVNNHYARVNNYITSYQVSHVLNNTRKFFEPRISNHPERMQNNTNRHQTQTGNYRQGHGNTNSNTGNSNFRNRNYQNGNINRVNRIPNRRSENSNRGNQNYNRGTRNSYPGNRHR